MQKPAILRLAVIGLLAALPHQAQADRQGIEIISDIAISGALAQMVLGDLGHVQVLLPPGADAHDYQLRPSQARAVQAADLHVWIGPALAPWMERALNSAGTGTPSVALLEVPGTTLLPVDGASHHDHGPVDPHAWLDPGNARVWLDAIAVQLATLDPDHGPAYRQNAEAAGQSIASLQARLTARLAPYSQMRFAVQHDAYAYFTRAFGLQDAIAVAASDAARPSAARLRQVQQKLAAGDVFCVFPEENHDDRLLRAAIEGSRARLAAPLAPEGGMIVPGPGLYAAVLENLTQSMEDCFSSIPVSDQ